MIGEEAPGEVVVSAEAARAVVSGPPGPKYHLAVTVILSLVALAMIVGLMFTVRQASSWTSMVAANPTAVVRDADASLPAAQGGRGGVARARIAESMRAVLNLPADARVTPEERTAARIILAIVLVDDGKTDDARAEIARLEPVELAAVTTKALLSHAPSADPRADTALVSTSLSAIGGAEAAATERLRRGLVPRNAAAKTPAWGLRDALAAGLRGTSSMALVILGALVILLYRRIRRPQAALAHAEAPLAPWTLWGFWSAFVRWLSISCVPLLVFAIVLGIIAAVRQKAPTIPPMVLGAAWELWLVWLIGPIFLRPWGLTWRTAFGLGRGATDLPRAAADGLVTAGIATGGAALLAIAMYELGVPGVGVVESQGLSATEGVFGRLTAVSYAVVGAPLLEELGFRGLVFGVLRTRIGWIAAACVASALFASIHPYGASGRITVGFYGLVFCWRYQRAGSLLPTMLAHAIINFAVIVRLTV